MQVLIAPDKFSGTLTAAQAAEAIAAGWISHSPHDTLDLAPMSDGGPGFVDAMHAAHGGELVVATVRGPVRDTAEIPAVFLRVGETAYVEAASAIGLHLRERPLTSIGARQASSYGLGQLLRAARETGVSRVVVGVGGTGTIDAGAGLLAGLGATCAGGALDEGCAGLREITSVDLTPAMALWEGVELVLAGDVDSPLTGLFGATKIFGAQKGVAEDELVAVDALLEGFAVTVDRHLSLQPAAGVGGGVGYALMLLGAHYRSGLELVAEAVDLPGRARAADLVITGEGSFDFSSRVGKVPAGVAHTAGEAIRPCIVLAGSVLVGSREMRALGIESAYAVVDLVGESEAFGSPDVSLEKLAARVARTWSAE